jgi:nicotinate-nucleotide adenylyltransferase
MSETPGHGERAKSDGGRRVAFFGGSFDPPHNGHLAVARAARAGLALDCVLFAPVGAQPLKMQGAGPGAGSGASASFADRLEMTRLAIADEPGFEISLADAPRTQSAPNFSPNYSFETLERLRAELDAAADAGARLFFLMGADSFFSLRQWHRAAEIPFAATLIVAARPGERVDELAAALPEGLTLEPWAEGDAVREGVTVRGFRVRDERGRQAELFLLPGLHVEDSASAIREGIRAAMRRDATEPGREGAGAAAGQAEVPTPVAAYIRAHGLYR